jgi:hypothetical protein
MLSNQPDNRQPDGTSEPTTPLGGASPVSGQPWSTPSGEAMPRGPYPPAFAPGTAPLPQPPNPDYPPTSEFPATPTAQIPQAYSPPDYAQADYIPPQYAPPQYSGPGYGAPGQPPYPAPSGKPPRKSSVPIIGVLVAVTLLLCGGVVTAGVLIARNVADRAEEAIEPLTDLPSAAPELPALPTGLPTGLPSLPAVPDLGGRKIKVTYEVTGEGQASQIFYVTKFGEAPTRLQNVDLPWKLTVEMETPALVSVVAMRIGTSDVSISCRAAVDGTEVEQRNATSGTVATATCNHIAMN